MTHSIDPDFAARLAEYQKKAQKGVAFQATGTIGGKKMRPQGAAWRARPIRTLFRLMVLAMVAKAFVFHIAHVAGIDARAIDPAQSMGLMQPVMDVILYPDPISVKASQYLTIGQLFFANELREIL